MAGTVGQPIVFPQPSTTPAATSATPSVAGVGTSAPISVPSPDANSDIVAGIKGGVNGLLFGAPEFIYRRMFPNGEKEYQDFIKKHGTAYNVGNVAGSIGSAFIPGIGLAGDAAKGIGLGAKALEGAKLLEGGAEAAKGVSGIAKLGNIAAKGVLTGALEGGVRGVTGSTPGQELQGGMQGVQSGALWGAGGQLVGEGVSALAGAAPRLLGEGAKKGMQKFLGTTELNSREAASVMRDMAGPGAKGLGKQAVSEDALQSLYDVGRKYGLNKPGMADEVFNGTRSDWKLVNDHFESAFPNSSASDLLNMSTTEDDLAPIWKMANSDVAKASLNKIGQDLAGVDGLANVRRYLDNGIADTYKPGATSQSAAEAQRALFSTLRSNLDEMVTDTAKKAGLPADFDTMKKEYLPLRAYAASDAKATMKVARTNTGSPTWEKMAMAGGGGALGLTQGDDIQTRIQNALLYGSLGYGAKRFGEKAADIAGATSVPLLKKLAAASKGGILRKLGANPELAGTVGAGIGSVAGQTAGTVAGSPDVVAAGMTGQGAAPGNPGEVESDPVNMNRLNAGIATEFMQATQGYYGGPDNSNPIFQRFHDSMMTAMKDNGQSDKINPRLAAGIMFQNPEQRDSYIKGLEAEQKMGKAFPVAAPALGPQNLLGGLFHPERGAAKSDILKAVADATGNDKGIQSAANRILNGTASQDVKFKKLMDMIRTANPQLAEAQKLGGTNG